jgi:hypothetical protein
MQAQQIVSQGVNPSETLINGSIAPKKGHTTRGFCHQRAPISRWYFFVYTALFCMATLSNE